jgi:hypothetical protein
MQSFAKDAIRLKYLTLYDGHAWRESMRLVDITLDPTLNGAFFIPVDTEEVIFCKISQDGVNYRRVEYRERDWIERVTGGNELAPFSRPIFYRSENLGWPYSNPGKLTLTTFELTPFQVHIMGANSQGASVEEDFQMVAQQDLNGNIIPFSVQTVNSYAQIYVFSKDTGILSVQPEAPAGAPALSIPGGMTELVFSQFVLFPNPIQNDSVTQLPLPCYVRTQVKLKADTLDNDMSVPRLSHIWDCLVEYTLSALYTRLRQLQKADLREQKAIAHFQAAINVEKNQSEFRQQVYPVVYETGDYLFDDQIWRVTSFNPFGY